MQLAFYLPSSRRKDSLSNVSKRDFHLLFCDAMTDFASESNASHVADTVDVLTFSKDYVIKHYSSVLNVLL